VPSDEIWPTPWGDSVGHWEGDTLVVETIQVDAQILDTRGARFTERIRKVGKDRLEDVLTMTSPSASRRGSTNCSGQRLQKERSSRHRPRLYGLQGKSRCPGSICLSNNGIEKTIYLNKQQ
jgi:hypothetical protein